ncbi:PcfB family protein [Paenibacillus sp. KQZ6P-2]|uniref:PcfB family protein n=1 Tax=Paenibacillus mangrovi TaxID=2931978 RepID=A0A9X2B353_9BACL|nr:PcfB family protein [Paenibacillus mangrovi]MCJ8010142.1 PcfB family protein [Paenibacillus mangrovi]
MVIFIPEMGGDVANIAAMIGTDLTKESMRMTNEAIKQLLIFLIQKAKENGDKAGETSLKNLAKSNDEIKIFDLEFHQLNSFAKQAKDYHVTYAVVEEQNRYSVFYKASDEMRIKRILENLVREELNSSFEMHKERDQEKQESLEGKLDSLKENYQNAKSNELKADDVLSSEVSVRQRELNLIILQNGKYERISNQISVEFRKTLEDMMDREERLLDVGNGTDRLKVQRVGDMYIFNLVKDDARNNKDLIPISRGTLREKRTEILPLITVQRERFSSGKNKHRERGGR